MKLDETTEILEIKMSDVETGNESLLYEKSGRKQHFRDIFKFKNYNIQLRLDWSDIRKGEPTLDADIWTEGKNKKKEFVQKGAWHHTERELDKETGLYVYKFRFNDLELTLQPKKKMAKTFSLDVTLVPSLSIKKISKNDETIS